MTAQEHYKPVIVLDVGRVLVDINPKVVLEELSRRAGREIGSLLQLDLEKLLFPLYAGTWSLEDIRRIVNGTLRLSLEPGEWRELWCRIVTGEVPGMREALAELKSEFRLVALSNTDEVHWKFLLKKYPIFELLDGWVVSYAEGITKPDLAMYSALVNRYCDDRLPFFYTDDTAHYVEAARSLGWEAEVFTDAAHFKEEVRKRCTNYLESSM